MKSAILLMSLTIFCGVCKATSRMKFQTNRGAEMRQTVSTESFFQTFSPQRGFKFGEMFDEEEKIHVSYYNSSRGFSLVLDGEFIHLLSMHLRDGNGERRITGSALYYMVHANIALAGLLNS